MRRILAVVLAVLLVSIPLGLAAARDSNRATSVNWLQYRRDNQRSGFNPYETTITPSTIAANPYGFGLKAIAYFPYTVLGAPSPPVIYRGVMYTVAMRFDSGLFDNDKIYSLFAMDAFSGRLKWTTDVGCFQVPTSPAIDVGANVIVLGRTNTCGSESHGGGVLAVDLATHAIRWNHGSSSGGTPPNVIGGNVYVTATNDGGGGYLRSVNSATGVQNWSVDAEHGTPSVGSGVVYTSSRGAPVVGSSLIYATGDVKAWNAADGAFKWSNTCPSGLCAFSKSGVVQWTTPFVAPLFSTTEAVVLARGVLYLICEGSSICAVNATTGALIWQTSARAASLTVAGGIVYWLEAPGGYLYLINAATGAHVVPNSIDFLGDVGVGTSAPVVNSGRVYVVTENRIHIYGLCGSWTPSSFC